MSLPALQADAPMRQPRFVQAPRAVTDEEVRAIPGWFTRVDIALFRFILAEQVRTGQVGDLAEFGVFHGSSSVLVGSYKQQGETFTVVDLFGSGGTDADNDAEVQRWYDGLTQDTFEANYRAIHGDLPVVVRGPSTDIRGRAASGRHRFVHVDASHEYGHVVDDLLTAKDLLMPGGIVVVDDFRAAAFPGVAAAVWPELEAGLVPVAMSDEKLFATWGDPAPWQRSVGAWAPGSGFLSQTHRIAQYDVVRLWSAGSRLAPWVPNALVPLARRVRSRLPG